jgi:hypothetical protein
MLVDDKPCQFLLEFPYFKILDYGLSSILVILHNDFKQNLSKEMLFLKNPNLIIK